MKNQIQQALEPIKANEQMKSDVKQFLQQSGSASMPKRNHFQFKRPLPVAAAACLVVVLLCVFQMQALYTQAAYVELTGPTQLGISLNSKNEVLNIVGLNKSGQLIAESVDVEHKTYEHALDTIMNCDAYQKNANANVPIDIHVECKNENSAAALKQETEKVCHRQQKRQGQHSRHGENHQKGHSN